MKTPLTRREFLERTSATVVAAPAAGILLRESQAPPPPDATTMPRRPLGRTGVTVPILAFGCGSRFMMYADEAQALGVLNEVIDSGITYLDTAADYGNGLSETRVGMVMTTRRTEVFLATKIPPAARTRDAALRAFEQSLKRLQTDHVDLVHLHSLGEADDLAKIEAPDGALKALYELRDQKAARFVGMTSHTNGAVMATAIERHDLNAVQMAMNPSRALQFEELALPAAVKKGVGVICMKVTAQEKLVGPGAGQAPMASLIRYAWSLPVSAAVIGMPRPEFIRENAAAARAFTPLSESEIERVRQQVAPTRASLEAFFRDHADA
jgi:aryl-alcohol dehydrogenase-like predicted oxidoreductase